MWQAVSSAIGVFGLLCLYALGLVRLKMKNDHEYRMAKLVYDNVKKQDEIDKKDFYDKNDNSPRRALNEILKENDKNNDEGKEN